MKHASIMQTIRAAKRQSTHRTENMNGRNVVIVDEDDNFDVEDGTELLSTPSSSVALFKVFATSASVILSYFN